MENSDRNDRRAEKESIENESYKQSAGATDTIPKLESEIDNLNNDKRELQDRIQYLRREYAQKYDALKTSVTFRVGDALVKAAMSPRAAITLPYRLWRLYRYYRSGKVPPARTEPATSEKSKPALYESTIATADGSMILLPALRRRIQGARILFMPTNSGGLGHLTRLLAIARRLKTNPRVNEIIFLTTSAALDVPRQEGFLAYYYPPWDQVSDKVPAKGWRDSLQGLLEMILRNHGVNVFVFDGVNIDLGIANAIVRRKNLVKIWVKRGMLKEGLEDRFSESERYFDLRLVPGELGQKSIAQDSAGRIVVPPMVFLDRDELLPRQDVIEQLGLDPSKKTIFVQLGAGNINDINMQSEIIIETARQFSDIQLVLAESLVSHSRLTYFTDVVTIRDYPLSRYYQGFDIAISAAGYNTVIELGYFGVPSIFIPNLETGADDQLGRAMIAQQTGMGTVLNPLKAHGLKQCLEELLDDTHNSEFRKRYLDICPVNGSDVATQVFTDFVFQ
jgi:hypothetical protein